MAPIAAPASAPVAAAPAWTPIGVEDQGFILTSPRTVRYGTGSTWSQLTLTPGAYTCSNSVFGDPTPGYMKSCDVLDVAGAPAVLQVPALVRTPTTTMAFADVVGSTPPTRTFAFGQLAATPDNGFAIRNQSDLALHFNPFTDFGGSATINSEIQRYQSFNPINHAFATDRLNLVGALTGGYLWNGSVSAPTSTDLSGNPNPIANLGLTSTVGLRVGQLAAVQYQGIYYISALVANTSVSFRPLGGSPTSFQYNQLIVWLPIDSATVTAATIYGQSVLSFASTPAGCTAGAAVGFVLDYGVITRNADYRVASASGGQVTLDQGYVEGDLANGARVLFMPPVTSGQIWSKDQFYLTDPTTFFAVEFDIDLMSGSRDYLTNGINSAAAYAASPADIPWGAWPALWMYSADDGLPQVRDWSEIDVMEITWSSTTGANLYTGYNHGPLAGDATYDKLDGGWTGNSWFNWAPSSLAGARKFQLVYSNGMTWKYIDGVLVKAAKFQWTSTAPVTIGINLAIGSLAHDFASNLSLPIQTANFASQKMGIKALRIWKA